VVLQDYQIDVSFAAATKKEDFNKQQFSSHGHMITCTFISKGFVI
jgi:hypothetical protein